MELDNFKDVVNEGKENKSAMRQWIIRNVENGNGTHGDIKRAFLKKYGSKYSAYFEQVVDELV